MGLKLTTGVSVFQSKRKAAFTGWVNDFAVVEIFFDMYVRPSILSFILTYKMIQDPLEIFFGSIRSSLGFNNNPTVTQFAGAYRNNCSGVILKSGEGSNCLWDDSVVMLEVETEDKGMLHSDPEAVYLTALESTMNNELRKDILIYVSGNVQRTVTSKLTWCHSCFLYFSLDYGEQATTCCLIRQKDLGGLVKPMKEVCDLVEVVDWVVEHNAKCSDFLATKNIRDKLAVSSLATISDMKPDIFQNLCEDPSHRLIVIKMFIKAFLNVKLGHICRGKTQKLKLNIRHIHKKMPIFYHE